MAVLLEGINIPEGNPITINIYRNIYRDGTWYNAYTTENGNVTEVPEPHGRLIDADSLIAYCNDFADMYKGSSERIDIARRDELLAVIGQIINEPTVIPASKERPAFLPQYELTPRSEEG